MSDSSKLRKAHICHVTTCHNSHDIRVYWRECAQIQEEVKKVSLVAPAERPEITAENIEIIPYVSKPPVGWRQRFSAAYKAAKTAADQPADLYHFHDPELLLPMARTFRHSQRAIVFDAHEWYGATIRQDRGIYGRVASQLYSAVESYALRSLSGVVSVTPQIVARYEKRVPHVALVRNFVDMDKILEVVPDLPPTVPGRLLFSGTLDQKSLFPLAEAIKLLADDYPELQVHLAGSFISERFQQELEDHWHHFGVSDRLQYLGRLPHKELLAYASRCMMGLVLFWPWENVKVALPNKLFEYMAVGLPVIVPDLPNQREIVEKEQCGLWCDTSDAHSIAATIRSALENSAAFPLMRVNGRTACQERYQMKHEARSLLALYEAVLA